MADAPKTRRSAVPARAGRRTRHGRRRREEREVRVDDRVVRHERSTTLWRARENIGSRRAARQAREAAGRENAGAALFSARVPLRSVSRENTDFMCLFFPPEASVLKHLPT